MLAKAQSTGALKKKGGLPKYPPELSPLPTKVSTAKATVLLQDFVCLPALGSLQYHSREYSKHVRK